MRPFALALAAAACALSGAAAPGCVSPELDGTNWACRSDVECGEGQVCSLAGEAGRCLAAGESGPIRLGMSAPFQGPNGELGTEMRRGLEAYFKRVNREGGVRGRPIELVLRDDGYVPSEARARMRELLDIQEEVPDPNKPDVVGPNGVLAVIGNVGTPTMLQTAPMATKNRVVFFAPFTGANEYLRDDTKSPYVFNYRASYYEETAAMVDFLFKTRRPRVADHQHVIAFVQADSFGDAGYNGFANAYDRTVKALPSGEPIARVTYEASDPVGTATAAVAQVTQRLQAFVKPLGVEPPPQAPFTCDEAAREPVAILMVDTYAAGNVLIRGVTDWVHESIERACSLDVAFLNVSFVGSDSLAEQLTALPKTYVDAPSGKERSYARDVIVTQVVPDYFSQAPGVAEYRNDIDEADANGYSFNSLEGYIAARLFVEGLRRHEGPLTSPALAQTLEGKMTNVDVGIGQPLNFSLSDHQASHKVWGSRFEEDSEHNVKATIDWTWTPEGRIVLE